MPTPQQLPDWELILSAAAHFQELLPDAVLVGGTASALHAQHRVSIDADHVLPDLRQRFDEVLEQLESVAGWKTARIQRPVQILGSLDGIETGIRQLIRDEPLETTKIAYQNLSITLPTEAEMLRIKAVLILKRNSTRDYLDFAALHERLGQDKAYAAMVPVDRLYPQRNGESPTQQLMVQLANPLPYDLEGTKLSEYKHLAPRWHNWEAVSSVCRDCSLMLAQLIKHSQAVRNSLGITHQSIGQNLEMRRKLSP